MKILPEALQKISNLNPAEIRSLSLSGSLDTELETILKSAKLIKEQKNTSLTENSASILYHKRKFYSAASLCEEHKEASASNNYYLSVIYGFFFCDYLTSINLIDISLAKQPENLEFIKTKFFLFLFHCRYSDAIKLAIDIPDTDFAAQAEALVKSVPKGIYKSPPHLWNIERDTIDPEAIKNLISEENWIPCFIALLYLTKKLALHQEQGFDLLAAYSLTLIKLNQKHELESLLTQNTRKPHSFEWSALKCFMHRWNGEYSDITEELNAKLPHRCDKFQPFYSLAFECLSESLLHLNEKESLHHLIEEDVALNGNKPWNNLYQGLIKLLNRDPKYKLYWQNAARNNSFFLNHSWGVNSYSGLGRHALEPRYISPTRNSATEKKATVLMSSDINYLGLYLRSIRKNSEKMPEIAWHLHVVIDRTYEEGFIEKLQNENKNIYFSFEFHSSLQPKAYYTMARFLYAEKEIENLQAPIIITDIDSILKSEDKLREILSINTADFGFKIAPYYHHFPWHKIQASATALYSKPKAKALLFQMKVWFSENYLEAHPNQWWIDQVALYEAFSNLTEKSSYIDIFKDVNLAFEFAKATPAAKAEMASKIAH